jgi:hypothetical protein
MARRNLVTAKTEQKIVAHVRHFDPISGHFRAPEPQATLATGRFLRRVLHVRHVVRRGGLALIYVIELLLGAAIGVACYKSAQSFENQHGRPQGNVSPTAWGFIGFFFGLIGALVQYIVGRSTLKKLPHGAPASYASWTPPPAPGYAPQPAQYPAPAPLAATPYAAPSAPAPPAPYPPSPYAAPPAQQQYPAAPAPPPAYAAQPPAYAAPPAQPEYSAPQFAGRAFSAPAPAAAAPSVPAPPPQYVPAPAPAQYPSSIPPAPQQYAPPPPAQQQYPSSIPPAPAQQQQYAPPAAPPQQQYPSSIPPAPAPADEYPPPPPQYAPPGPNVGGEDLMPRR